MPRSMTATAPVVRAPVRHATSEWLALWVALVTIVVGVAGLPLTPAHAIVHLVVGATGIALWSSPGSARSYGWFLAAGYLAAFLYGLYAMGDLDLEVLTLRNADNVFHLGSAALGLVIGLWPDD